MTKHHKTILIHFIFAQPSSSLSSCFLHWLMQTLGLGTKTLTMVVVFGIECAPFYDNLNQFQMWHCFCELAKIGHVHIVHIVRVHNGDINDVKHDLMPLFVIMPLRGAITMKLMLDINFPHAFIIFINIGLVGISSGLVALEWQM